MRREAIVDLDKRRVWHPYTAMQRYIDATEPLFTRHCWCRDCQYIGAGAGTVNVFFASETVKVEGALSEDVSAAASGNLMHRQFCPACGTPVFTQTEARRQYLGVRAGTLDDPELGKPQMAIWISSAPRLPRRARSIPSPAARRRRAPPAGSRTSRSSRPRERPTPPAWTGCWSSNAR